MTAGRRAGIDVGGTKCLGVVIDDAGVVIDEVRRSTPVGAEPLLDTLVSIVGDLGPVDSVGVGLPGLVSRGGVLRAAPNLVDVGDLAVGDLLAARLGHEVHVDNDATCAAVAEWLLGAGRGVDDLVVVTLGTGIGSGIVVGGRLVRGANGYTGEAGHMVVDPDGPACPCGRRGCWERYASGSGLARLASAAVASGRLVHPGDSATVLRGEDVFAAAGSGDVGAAAVVDEFARWVAVGLANLTNLLDPARLVVGGGLVAAQHVFMPAVRRWFPELLYAPGSREHPEITVAILGDRAGAVGAALLAEVQ